ncbi:phage tail protein [Paenibacillus pedocola]|uniref:phage tail protein n=1 Tax=Paenibacillus pedocola TaxID=3242193 RepID=UPI002877B889|nr:phage tail protein [Paenibacillus typhae]
MSEAETTNYTIGAFGPVIFKVSEDKVLTFQDLTRSSAGRWAQHDILGKKPKKEWLGPGVDSVSFTMRFVSSLELNPRTELDRLTELERAGKALPLVIGNKGLGTGLWVITSLSQAWEQIDNKGYVYAATVDITLEEYVK